MNLINQNQNSIKEYSLTKAQELLKHFFGYDTFRTGQEELIQTILEGRDCLRHNANRSWKVNLLSNSRHNATRYNHCYFTTNFSYERPSR